MTYEQVLLLDFVVGSKVISISKDSSISGLSGTVVKFRDIDVLIDFGPGFKGHTGIERELGDSHTGWYVEKKYLRKIK